MSPYWHVDEDGRVQPSSVMTTTCDLGKALGGGMAEEYVKAMCRGCYWRGWAWELDRWGHYRADCTACQGKGWVPLSINELVKEGGQVPE